MPSGRGKQGKGRARGRGFRSRAANDQPPRPPGAQGVQQVLPPIQHGAVAMEEEQQSAAVQRVQQVQAPTQHGAVAMEGNHEQPQNPWQKRAAAQRVQQMQAPTQHGAEAMGAAERGIQKQLEQVKLDPVPEREDQCQERRGRGRPKAIPPGESPRQPGAVAARVERQIESGAAGIDRETECPRDSHAMDSGNARPSVRPKTRRQMTPANDLTFRGQYEAATSTHGTEGRPLTLMSNHASLVWEQSGDWLQYRVDFTPIIERRSWRGAMIRSLAKVIGTDNVFTGEILYTLHKLPQPLREVVKHPSRQQDENIVITIKFTNALPSSSPEIIGLMNSMFNVIMRDGMKTERIGRKFFDPKKRTSAPSIGCEVMSGYEMSVLPYEAGIQLELDIVYCSLKTKTVLDEMEDILHNTNGSDSDKMARIKSTMMKRSILSRHLNKVYRIAEVTTEIGPDSLFDYRGKQISFRQYYSQHYNIELREGYQPMLVMVLSKKEITHGRQAPVLPAELCITKGLSASDRTNKRVKMELSKLTKLQPQERFNEIHETVENLNSKGMENMEKLGLKLDSELVKCQARQFLDVKVVMKEKSLHKNVKDIQPQNASWRRDLSGSLLLKPVPLGNWLVIVPRWCAQDKLYIDFMTRFTEYLEGIGVDSRKWIEIIIEKPITIESYKHALERNITKEMKYVLVITETQRQDIYDKVKAVTIIKCPVLSQVVVFNTLKFARGGVDGIAKGVALQAQSKLGADLWAVKGIRDMFPEKSIYMVMGLDVYHDTDPMKTGEKRSVVGCVTSMNIPLTTYYSQHAFQPRGQEIINTLDDMMYNALQKFYSKANGKLPTHLLVYRDGVSDGQLDIILEQEGSQIDRAIARIREKVPEFKEYRPCVTIVVIKKRIQTRFFYYDQTKHCFSNPGPGTVVDRGVTRPEWYDFFLVSQSVSQGTVTPTHYNVIRDTAQWHPDKIQRLTYMMTHLYTNWPGTIRVPAPAQYAHKLAYVIGTHLHRDPAKELEDFLWYL